jgi:P4 family phage/plasmid primase-like protien
MDLPVLTVEHAREICSEFERICEEAGWERVGSGSTGQQASTPKDAADRLAEDVPPDETPLEVARVKSALAVTTKEVDGVNAISGYDYDRWMSVLFALKWTKWRCAEDLAREWSEQSDKHNAKDFKVKWKGAEKHGRSNPITLGTLFNLAKEAGWDASRKDDVAEQEAEIFDTLMDELEFIDPDDNNQITAFVDKVAESGLSIIAEERILQAVKAVSKISIATLRKGAKAKRIANNDKATHAFYALKLLDILKADSGVAPVGVEGMIYVFQPLDGIWKGRLVPDFEVEVAQNFDGMEHCERRSDYLAIAAHLYAITSQDNEEFFEKSPIGMACEGRFYAVENSTTSEIRREVLTHKHRQRVLSPYKPVVGECPMFMQFLYDCFGDDDLGLEQIKMLQEYIGAALLGIAAIYERVAMFKGPGRSGKGTVQKIIEALFPATARCAVTPARWDSEYYAASLAGKRLNVVGELPDDEPIPAAAFKSVIGRDTITGRHPTHRPFQFRNAAAHIFSSNHFVFTKDHSDAFYTRWLLFGFNNSRIGKEDTIVVGLVDKMIEAGEMPAICAWAFQGGKRVVERGWFQTSRMHDLLMAQWQRRTSTLMEFIQDGDECHLGSTSEHFCRRAAFYEAYSRWCRDSNRRPLGKQRLYDEMETSAVAKLGVRFAALSGNSVVVRGVMLKGTDFIAFRQESDDGEL